MRRRSPAAQVLSGVVVAVVMTAAAAVVYLAFAEGTAAIRAGQADHALKAGLVALGAAVVAVLALTGYGHWLAVTDPPVSRRGQRVPSLPELVLAGLAVAVLVVAAWPILSLAYQRAGRAYESLDLAPVVGWGVLAVAYVWFVVFSVEHFVGWVRRRGRLGDPLRGRTERG